jgi:hypothetical protein
MAGKIELLLPGVKGNLSPRAGNADSVFYLGYPTRSGSFYRLCRPKSGIIPREVTDVQVEIRAGCDAFTVDRSSQALSRRADSG